MYFYYFEIISPWKRAESFIWTKNLNPLHSRMLCAKFGWNWPNGSGEEIFKFHQCYFAFMYYLPLEKGGTLRLNKRESPSSKDTLCQVWLKLVQWFWRKRFLEILLKHFHHFVIISPWKRAGPFIWTNLNSLR